MQSFNKTLGLKKIPQRFAAVLSDESLTQAFSDAQKLISETPSGWEIVEVEGGGGGFQPLDLPFKSVPVELSEEEKKRAQEQINVAYKKINAALKQMDKRIKEQENSTPRRLLLFLGTVLVVTGIAILLIALFRHTELNLTGKGGAVTLLLGSGIPILTSIYLKDRELRTLSSRIRAQLGACFARAEYSEIRECFRTTVEQLNSAFSAIQHRIKTSPGGTDISL